MGAKRTAYCKKTGVASTIDTYITSMMNTRRRALHAADATRIRLPNPRPKKPRTLNPKQGMVGDLLSRL